MELWGGTREGRDELAIVRTGSVDRFTAQLMSSRLEIIEKTKWRDAGRGRLSKQTKTQQHFNAPNVYKLQRWHIIKKAKKEILKGIKHKNKMAGGKKNYRNRKGLNKNLKYLGLSRGKREREERRNQKILISASRPDSKK